MDFLSSLPAGTVFVLILALLIAFAFEFVNGFHDTANAVATVIYTNSMKPTVAVIWSGVFNFLGVIFSGIAVAYSIVYLLPVDLLIESSSQSGLAMVLSLLLAALLWNVGTWYLGLPASSSHALIGSILGIGLMNGVITGKEFGAGVNWSKAGEVGLSLLLSPLIGFFVAGLLLLALKRFVRVESLYKAPQDGKPPPRWIRGILIFTCTGVSFGHGSNDGQKGMGLIMLILIGIIPGHFAVNSHLSQERVAKIAEAAGSLSADLRNQNGSPELLQRLEFVRTTLTREKGFEKLTEKESIEVRNALLLLRGELKSFAADLGPQAKSLIVARIDLLKEPIEYVPLWVVIGVGLALGVGTTVGWKRIVITVGEKIGKAHLTYAQGASAEVTAMATILAADYGGLPVSTTQVLSSGVCGTMAANGSGVNISTVRKILLAWVFTLPATMILSASFFALTKWLGW